MFPPEVLLGEVGKVLLGADWRAGGSLNNQAVLVQEAFQAIRRADVGVCRLKNAHHKHNIFLSGARPLRQDGWRVRIPPEHIYSIKVLLFTNGYVINYMLNFIIDFILVRIRVRGHVPVVSKTT